MERSFMVSGLGRDTCFYPEAVHRSDIMDAVVANGEVSIPCPEGFKELDQTKLDSLYMDENHDRIGISDEERHMIVCLFWHKANPLLSKMANAKDICTSTEKRLRCRLSGNGYAFETFFERTICGQQGQGFRHTYDLQGIGYTSEIIVFKRDNVSYTLYTYARTENMEGCRPILDGIVDSMSFL